MVASFSSAVALFQINEVLDVQSDLDIVLDPQPLKGPTRYISRSGIMLPFPCPLCLQGKINVLCHVSLTNSCHFTEDQRATSAPSQWVHSVHQRHSLE